MVRFIIKREDSAIPNDEILYIPIWLDLLSLGGE